MRAVVLATAVACGGSPNTPRVAKPAPSIALLDPGAAPRQRLRYEPTLHVPERSETSLKLRAATTFTNTVLETGHRSADFPTARITERIEVTGFTAAGDALVSCEIEEAAVLDDVVDPAILAPSRTAIAAVKGLRSSWRRAPSGMLSEIVFDAPNASPSMRDQLFNISESIRESSAMFPDAAIPIGWRIRWSMPSRRTPTTW